VLELSGASTRTDGSARIPFIDRKMFDMRNNHCSY
jgi:hypothetical protein